MQKPINKIQVRPKRSPIPSAQELKVPGYGEKRFMTDEEAAKYRTQLIAFGRIKEDPAYDGYMSKDQTTAVRNRLIKNDILSPGTGFAKLKAARARSFLARRDGGSDGIRH